MNFKPNLWKSIVSLIGGIGTNYGIASSMQIVCIRAPCPQPTWIDSAFEPVLITITLTATLIIYSVWSLLQKK